MDETARKRVGAYGGEPQGADRLQQHEAVHHFRQGRHSGIPAQVPGLDPLEKGRARGGQRRLREVVNENVGVDGHGAAGGQRCQVLPTFRR